MIPDHLTMESSQAPSYMETVQVTSSTTSSIQVAWEVNHDTSAHVEGFRVHYQKVASTYIQYGPMLSASIGQYSIQNLVADTYYKVCLVMYRNDTQPIRECIDASTTNWHIPVSIGSSIGAILALSMIVLVVLVSRCPSVVKWRGKQYKKSQKYDSMSSHYHDDHFEFSDTATHGHDDEFVSEFDPSCNDYSFENSHSNYHSKEHHSKEHHSKEHHSKEHRSNDRMCNGNRNHVSSISHSQSTKYMGARPKVYIPSHHHSYHHANSSLQHSIERQQSLDLGQQEDLNHNHHHNSGSHHHHHNDRTHHHQHTGVTLTSPVQSYGPAELESNSAYIRPDEGPEEIVYSEERASSPPHTILQSATDYEMKEIKKTCSPDNCVASAILDHHGQEEHTV